jgi:uncharacterized protein (DUF1330 family)
VAQIKGDTG